MLFGGLYYHVLRLVSKSLTAGSSAVNRYTQFGPGQAQRIVGPNIDKINLTL